MRGNAENPEASEREQEEAREGRQAEQDAMTGHGHDDPGVPEEDDDAA